MKIDYNVKQLRFLARAGEVLGSSLDYEKTLTEVARLAVPTLADWCILDLMVDGGELRRLAVVHRNPEKQDLARELQTRYPVLKLTNKHTLVKVVRSGRAWLNPNMSDEKLEAEARDRQHYLLLRELGYKSEMVIQLEARGHLIGALTLVNGESGRRYSDKDLVIGQELARRAALAIDNARLMRETELQRGRLQVILSSIADGVIAVDRNGSVSFVNPVAADLTGFSESEALGQSLDLVFRLAS